MPWSNQNGKKSPWGSVKEDENKGDAKPLKEKEGEQSKGPSIESPWAKKPQNKETPSSFGQKQKPNFSGVDFPPELKTIFKKGQNQFQGGSYKPIVFLALFALVALWLFQCFYVVQQNEKAVQLWLGKPEDKIINDGLHFHFWPVESYYKVPLTEQNIAIGYAYNNDQSDSLMLSGDQNIVNVRFLLYYNISDPIAYLFNVTDPVGTIRQVAESAMREVVGRRPIDDVYRDKREDVANDVLKIIQTTVNKYGLGVNITRVSISEAAPPSKVSAAFNSVQQAEQERNRVIEEGNKVRATKLGLANGEASKRRAKAKGEKARMIEETRGRAEQFKALAKEEKLNPDLVRYRLYMEVMGKLLSSPNKLILEDKSGMFSHLPLEGLLGANKSTKVKPSVVDGGQANAK